MERKDFDEAKRYSDEIAELLKDSTLAPEDRQKLETIQAGLSGALLHSWLPFDWKRRLIMATLFVVGVIGLLGGNSYLLLAWLTLPVFSPRAMGELAFFLGRISRLLRGPAP